MSFFLLLVYLFSAPHFATSVAGDGLDPNAKAPVIGAVGRSVSNTRAGTDPNGSSTSAPAPAPLPSGDAGAGADPDGLR